MLPGSGYRPRYTPRREPETPRGYGRREEYEGERGPRGRGKSALKFDGKSNWKAFYGFQLPYLLPLGRTSLPLVGTCGSLVNPQRL
jgi:hypothetical protein